MSNYYLSLSISKADSQINLTAIRHSLAFIGPLAQFWKEWKPYMSVVYFKDAMCYADQNFTFSCFLLISLLT